MIQLSATPVLETERLILRAPVATDYPAFAEFYGSERAKFIGGTSEEGKAWRNFGHIIGHWVLRGFGMFVVTSRATGEPVGLVGPWFPEGWPEREIGWSIWSGEGRGIAYEAADAALDFAFLDLGWHTAVSYVADANLRSSALAERLGASVDPDAVPMKSDDPIRVYRHPRRTA